MGAKSFRITYIKLIAAVDLHVLGPQSFADTTLMSPDSSSDDVSPIDDNIP